MPSVATASTPRPASAPRPPSWTWERSPPATQSPAVSAATTPKLQHLLLKSMMVFGLSTYPTKMKYQRPRPFMERPAIGSGPGKGWARKDCGEDPQCMVTSLIIDAKFTLRV